MDGKRWAVPGSDVCRVHGGLPEPPKPKQEDFETYGAWMEAFAYWEITRQLAVLAKRCEDAGVLDVPVRCPSRASVERLYAELGAWMRAEREEETS